MTGDAIKRKRILVAHGSYAIAVHNDPFMSEATWWKAAVDVLETLHVATDQPEIDQFFATHFSPMWHEWVRDHPDLEGIETLYWRYKRNVRDVFPDKSVR